MAIVPSLFPPSTFIDPDNLTQDFVDSALTITSTIQDMQDQFSPRLKVCRFNPWVRLPFRLNVNSPTWDLFTPHRFHDIILPGQTKLIPLGIWFKFPYGYYGQLQSNLPMSLAHSCFVESGIIDPTDTMEVKVLIHNRGKSPYFVNGDSQICKMIMLRYENTILHADEITREEYESLYTFN